MAKRKTSTSILNYFEPQAKQSRTEESTSESGSESGSESEDSVSPLSRYVHMHAFNSFNSLTHLLKLQNSDDERGAFSSEQVCDRYRVYLYYWLMDFTVTFIHRSGAQPDSPIPTAETFLDPAVLSGDYKRVVQLKQSRALSDPEKHHLLTNHFVPPPHYTFPPHDYGKQKRHFQLSWLSRYNGLVYSELDDGGYCKYCVLFGQPSPSVPTLAGTFVIRPLAHLGKASEKLREHFEGVKGGSARKYHLKAFQVAEMFMNVMSKKQLPIDQQLSRARELTVAKNRKLLMSIADTVILCGRQGISFRGHRDSMKHLDLDNSTTNPGNFLALLKFRAESGDSVLANHLQSGSKNALYVSKTIQNELIEICGHIYTTVSDTSI